MEYGGYNMEKKLNNFTKHNVLITDAKKLNRYLNEKSYYRYNQILEKLLEFNRPLTDVHLNDFYKYDIRLRRLLFKYLTAYEIMLRGKVLNENVDKCEQIEKLTFGQLIELYYPKQTKLKLVKNLRNMIFHHRLIQLLDEKEVIKSIQIMLEKLNKEKFYKELEGLTKHLILIKIFKISDGKIKYDYLGSD